MKLFLVIAIVVALITGCAAATPLPSGQDNPSHPDHPANAEIQSALPIVDGVLTDAGRGSTNESDPFRAPMDRGTTPAPTPTHGHVHPADAPAPPLTRDAALYICPMHPEVTAAAPGRCPKCGMFLVEKESR